MAQEVSRGHVTTSRPHAGTGPRQFILSNLAAHNGRLWLYLLHLRTCHRPEGEAVLEWPAGVGARHPFRPSDPPVMDPTSARSPGDRTSRW